MHGEWMFVEWMSENVSGTDLHNSKRFDGQNISQSRPPGCTISDVSAFDEQVVTPRITPCGTNYQLSTLLSCRHLPRAANGGQSELPQYALDVKRADSNGPRAARAVYRLIAQQRWIKMSRLSSHRRRAIPFHSVVRWLVRVKGCMKKKLP